MPSASLRQKPRRDATRHIATIMFHGTMMRTGMVLLPPVLQSNQRKDIFYELNVVYHLNAKGIEFLSEITDIKITEAE